MTAVSGGVDRGASDKTHRYERLRARMLESHRTPVAVASAVVLVRQGMSVWMQLDDDPCTSSRADNEVARDHTALPAAEHRELVAALTGLIFHLFGRKESA